LHLEARLRIKGMAAKTPVAHARTHARTPFVQDVTSGTTQLQHRCHESRCHSTAPFSPWNRPFPSTLVCIWGTGGSWFGAGGSIAALLQLLDELPSSLGKRRRWHEHDCRWCRWWWRDQRRPAVPAGGANDGTDASTASPWDICALEPHMVRTLHMVHEPCALTRFAIVAALVVLYCGGGPRG
jgi:hypothetical protein